jgi:anti-anti-sigma regulatory factor
VTAPCTTYHLVLRRLDDGLAVHPVGRLPADGWLTDERVAGAAGRLGPRRLYLGCGGVTGLNSAGAAELVRLCYAVRARGGRVVLCAPPPPLREVLRITRVDQADLSDIRDEGPPGGEPRLIDPAWLGWQGGTVVRLARPAGEEGAADVMPVLADALEEAGCRDPDLLSHCRGPGPHVRGCWVVGVLLEKQQR